MTLGSLFDGSGGFPLAGVLAGITPIWSSEIEPYPLRVTAARFPEVEQLGSVTEIDGGAVEPMDIITFGSPCQDLSVAGMQLGIHEGQRSNLFFEAVRIIKEMREADERIGRTGVDIRPRFAVWENVPGAFSSNKGSDFQAVLQALASIRENGVSIPQPKKWGGAGCVVGDGWSIAWRVYDAQYWGVPQRRKRIYLVADFGSERAGQILFERESVRGNPAQGGEAGEGTTADAAGGAGGSGGIGLTNRGYMSGDKAETLRAESHMALPCVVQEKRVKIRAAESGSNQVPDVCYALKGNFIDRDTKQNGIGWRDGKMYTLDVTDRHAVALDCRNMVGNEELCATLQAKNEGGFSLYFVNPVVYRKKADEMAVCVGNGQLHQTDLGDKIGALNCMHDQQAVIHTGKPPRKYIVRRLTPLECCRLQGFPDWWEDGVEGSDSARYKMWGNGIALPCAYDVLRRIAKEANDGAHTAEL